MANSFISAGVAATESVNPRNGATVFALSCQSTSAAIGYCQLHDTSTTPGAGDVPRRVFPVYPNTTTVIGRDFFSEKGDVFTNGVAFAWSTTARTYTAATASEQFTQVDFA